MKFPLIVLSLFLYSFVSAQTLPNFDAIKLEKASDYKPAEPYALQTANYILTTPFKKDDKDRNNALQFLGKWMNGTPDYAFTYADIIDKIGNDNDILSIFMVSKVKYALENKANAKDQKILKLNAVILLLDYCNRNSSSMRMTKQLKKLAAAKDKGELEQAL